MGLNVLVLIAPAGRAATAIGVGGEFLGRAGAGVSGGEIAWHEGGAGLFIVESGGACVLLGFFVLWACKLLGFLVLLLLGAFCV